MGIHQGWAGMVEGHWMGWFLLIFVLLMLMLTDVERALIRSEISLRHKQRKNPKPFDQLVEQLSDLFRVFFAL
ncbi:hypothetical protein B0J18DRAFT_420399 [Chaetomium sp. MPI-SDFR-AT-0129]|nr:hypothetical protein B0J18DRAFT_420399 [Chaetomium sp. MPI-SDFR-AT-0129]